MALTFDADESDLKLFLQEADEQIELLQNETIRLEKEYQDQALVQNIFRAAHTLKGSSGMIGHHRMTDLTHAMESVFDMIRKNMLVPTTEIVDTILASLDGLNVLREEVATKEESDVDLSGSIAALHAIVDGPAAAPTTSTAAAEAAEDLSPEALKQAAALAGSPTSLLNKRWLEDA
ncbi:MAG: Hpt domain-containing protein, partial [Chloroflexota bacterium]